MKKPWRRVETSRSRRSRHAFSEARLLRLTKRGLDSISVAEDDHFGLSREFLERSEGVRRGDAGGEDADTRTRPRDAMARNTHLHQAARETTASSPATKTVARDSLDEFV